MFGLYTSSKPFSSLSWLLSFCSSGSFSFPFSFSFSFPSFVVASIPPAPSGVSSLFDCLPFSRFFVLFLTFLVCFVVVGLLSVGWGPEINC